jgi:phosphoadenosine phosphosulfate reductase
MSGLTLAERREAQRRHDAARVDHLTHRAVAPRRSPDELKALAEAAAEKFQDARPEAVLPWVAEEFGYRAAVACSMADAVLPAVVAEYLPWVDTLFLDTGYHFAETIGTRDAVESTMKLTLVDVKPQRTVAEQDAEFGEKLYERDPALCCQMRKVEPLTQRLADYEVWLSGVRRDEGGARAETPVVIWDDNFKLVKVNPLALWTFDEMLDYAKAHDIIVNPLLSDGFLSIGCAPCTRRVGAGEDARAGRWAGFEKTECGLHA